MVDGLNEREKEIIHLLTEDPSVTVHELGKRLYVSEVTIRTDLKSLSQRGFVTRTHGGAIPAFHKNILDRQNVRVEEKNRIAKAAAELVQEGDTVMIEAGTTTALIARYLLGKGSIHIVSDSTLLLPFVKTNPALQLTMLGGEFRSATESFVGPMGLEAVRRFNVKIAFLGTDGFSIERGLTTHLVEAAEMVKAMAAQADRTVLVADSGKYGKSGFVTMLPVTVINTVVTDSGMPEAVVTKLRELGVEVILA